MSSRPTDLEALQVVADRARDAVEGPVNAEDADTIETAIAEIQELRLALGEPVPELAKTTALVLYFPDQAAADGFEKLVTEAMPGLKARTLR